MQRHEVADCFGGPGLPSIGVELLIVLLARHLPTGQGAAQTVTTWMANLHMARVGGWPMRLGTSALGLTVVVLTFTGALLWLRKRAGRRRSNRSGFP